MAATSTTEVRTHLRISRRRSVHRRVRRPVRPRNRCPDDWRAYSRIRRLPSHRRRLARRSAPGPAAPCCSGTASAAASWSTPPPQPPTTPVPRHRRPRRGPEAYPQLGRGGASGPSPRPTSSTARATVDLAMTTRHDRSATASRPCATTSSRAGRCRPPSESKTAHIVFFILVLIAFGILVGPVNLFVFAKSGQRHRLFITTPIISVGASLLLIVLILFQDGFGGRGSRLLLMEVRSGRHRECRLSSPRSRSPGPGSCSATGFTTSEPGYLTPVLIGGVPLGPRHRVPTTAATAATRSRSRRTACSARRRLVPEPQRARPPPRDDPPDPRPHRARPGSVPTRSSPPPSSSPSTRSTTSTPDGSFWIGRERPAGTQHEARHIRPRSSLDPRRSHAWLRPPATSRLRRDATGSRLRRHPRPASDHFVATSTGVAAVTETLESINWKETQADPVTGPVVNP